MNVRTKFEVRSFTHSRDNREYSKNLGSLWIRQRSLFSQIFHGLLFGWTLRMYLTNLKFVAIPTPEIIGGTQKLGSSPWICSCSLLSQIFHGLLFRWTLRMYLANLKFITLPVPGIIGGTQKIRPRSFFSQIFNKLLFGWTL